MSDLSSLTWAIGRGTVDGRCLLARYRKIAIVQMNYCRLDGSCEASQGDSAWCINVCIIKIYGFFYNSVNTFPVRLSFGKSAKETI